MNSGGSNLGAVDLESCFLFSKLCPNSKNNFKIKEARETTVYRCSLLTAFHPPSQCLCPTLFLREVVIKKITAINLSNTEELAMLGIIKAGRKDSLSRASPTSRPSWEHPWPSCSTWSWQFPPVTSWGECWGSTPLSGQSPPPSAVLCSPPPPGSACLAGTLFKYLGLLL